MNVDLTAACGSLGVHNVPLCCCQQVKHAHFSAWTDDTLDLGLYTTHSEMYQIGRIMAKWEADTGQKLSRVAASFKTKLLAKQLSASQALEESWMRGLG